MSNQFSSKSKFQFILTIKTILFECHRQGLQIILAWIPGHTGIVGNETVDSFAKQATLSGSLNHCGTYPNDLASLAKKQLLTEWSKFWKESSKSKGKFYANIQPDIPHSPWFTKMRNAKKSVVSTLCRLRLGHVCTPVFLAKIRVRDSSLCECGIDEGTPDHIFFNCSKNSHSLYSLLPSHVHLPTDFSTILSLVYSDFVNILCSSTYYTLTFPFCFSLFFSQILGPCTCTKPFHTISRVLDNKQSLTEQT
ncbi:hypothetical protein evm_001116 [Chilo suppressalis]|nr:hypothetical protein evm_001116 [Chilo suppressalis]